MNGTLVLVDAQAVSIESTRGEPPRVIERTAIVDVSPPADDVDRWGRAYLLVFPFILLVVFAKHVVHPERSAKNGVSTQPFSAEEAPDEASS